MKNKASEKNLIEKTKKERFKIKQPLNKIWNNIKILKFLTIVSTVLALILGGIDITNSVSDKLTNRMIKKLHDSSLQLNNGNKEFSRKWIADVEKLSNKPKYINDYNLLKGVGLTMAVSNKDQLFNTELSPEYYLKRISVESKYFDDALIFRLVNITLNNSDSLRILKSRQLITELDIVNFKTPRYYFIKFNIAQQGFNLDTLISYYNDFNDRYFEQINYNTQYVLDVIEMGGKIQSELTQIQTLEYLYKLSIVNAIRLYRTHNILPDIIDNIKLNKFEQECIAYLKRINKIPDKHLGFLRGGFDAFMLSNPLFTLSMHVKYFDDDSQWFKYQRLYLKQFINSNEYINFWAQ
jgi:hypothetical protein